MFRAVFRATYQEDTPATLQSGGRLDTLRLPCVIIVRFLCCYRPPIPGTSLDQATCTSNDRVAPSTPLGAFEVQFYAPGCCFTLSTSRFICWSFELCGRRASRVAPIRKLLPPSCWNLISDHHDTTKTPRQDFMMKVIKDLIMALVSEESYCCVSPAAVSTWRKAWVDARHNGSAGVSSHEVLTLSRCRSVYGELLLLYLGHRA